MIIRQASVLVPSWRAKQAGFIWVGTGRFGSAPPSGGAPTPVQTTGLKSTTTGSGAVTFTNAFAANVASGGGVILTVFHVFGSGNTNNALSGVTLGGTAATLALEEGDNGEDRLQIWYARNVTGGSRNIVLTCSAGTANELYCSAEEWAPGLLDASPVDQTASVAPTSGTFLDVTTGATTKATELVYCVGGTHFLSGGAFSGPTTGATADYSQTWTQADRGCGGWKYVSAAGTQTGRITAGGSTGIKAMIATFKVTP